MAVEETSLGLKVPDGNDPVRNGDNLIAENALVTQALFEEDRAKLADLEHRTTSHIDGGTPNTLYAPEQTIDGGTV